jgi:hypothetical protein
VIILGYPIVRLFTRMAEKAQDKERYTALQRSVIQDKVSVIAADIASEIATDKGRAGKMRVVRHIVDEVR